MGYTTNFDGQLTVTPPLNVHEIAYLNRFCETARFHRTRGPYFVSGSGSFGQGIDPDVLDEGRRHPPEQPGKWCQWVPSDDGTRIEWDQGEKFYDADHWMAYLIDTFFKPGATVARELADPIPDRDYPEQFAHFTFDHLINGTIEAVGEEEGDSWRLEVRDNVVYVMHLRLNPVHDEFSPIPPDEWTAQQCEEFERLPVRHQVIFQVGDGEWHELAPDSGISFPPVTHGDAGSR